MALVVKDRVQETSTTTGTGTLTLDGAVTGFQSFSVIGNANTTYYAIVGGAEFEVGIGTYTSSGTTLSRTTVLESSNAGSLVNFSAGTKNVFVTYPAERALYTDGSSNAIALGTPASATLTNATGLPISTGVSGLGTNVATALAVNVGSSGALVTNGGALGTPSSGTLTNATGLPLATGVTGTLPIANGGTGTTSTTFTNLTTNVTGTLPIANGGTGATSNATTGFALKGANSDITSITGLTTALTVAQGGTGATTLAGANIAVVNATNTFSAVQTFNSSNLKLAGSTSGTSVINAQATAGTTVMTLPTTTSTLGYLNLPAVGTKTGSYTLATADIGKYVQVGSGGSITIPDATFAEGDAISIFNNTAGAITITCTITTAYIAGTDADKATVSLATRGVCTILFISGTVCVITGNVS